MSTQWTAKSRRRAAFILALCTLFVLCVSPAIVTAKKKSDFDPSGRPEFDILLPLVSKQGTGPEVRDYLTKTSTETQSTLMRVVGTCTTVDPSSSWPRMIFILTVDEVGTVKEARANSNAALPGCIEKAWVGIKYTAPPRAPFYRMVVLEAKSPRGV